MRLFDTHCHLFMEPLQSDLEAVLSRSTEAGVQRLIVPSVDRESIRRTVTLGSIPGIQIALGIHPWQAEEIFAAGFLMESLNASGACAVGEIGLDWKSPVVRERQMEVFTSQLRVALEMNLPVILHCRNAYEEMLTALKDYPVKGVIHAWSRSPELMERFLDAGLVISFGGAVTRPGARNALRSAAAVPSDRFVLETDAPSIGLRNVPSGESEPAHIVQVLGAMAEIRQEEPETLSEKAWRNSVRLFGDG